MTKSICPSHTDFESEGAGRIFSVAVVHVCNDADDLPIHVVDYDSLAKRVLTWK